MTFPDALRAIASLVVVLPHARGLFTYWASPTWPTWVMTQAAEFGTHGVQIFFVLSGFVIAYTLRQRRVTGMYFAEFVVRRSVRLDPAYWSAIGLSLVYLVIQGAASHKPIQWPSVPQLLAHLFYLQNILHYPQINVVFWTLCIEIQLYISFCLLLGVYQHVAKLSGAVGRLTSEKLFAATFVLSLAWPAHLALEMGEWFFNYWYGFLAGALVWYAVQGRLPVRVVGVLLALLVGVGLWRQDSRALVVAATSVMLLVCAETGGLYRWLAHPPVQFLGRLSYCIYLVHVPVAGVLIGIHARVAPGSQWVSFGFLGIVYLVTLLLAYVLHVAVERPSLRWSQKIKALRARKESHPIEAVATGL